MHDVAGSINNFLLDTTSRFALSFKKESQVVDETSQSDVSEYVSLLDAICCSAACFFLKVS